MGKNVFEATIQFDGDVSKLQKGLQTFQNDLNKLKLPANITTDFNNTFTEMEKQIKKYQSYLDSGFKKKSDITGLESAGAAISRLLQIVQNDLGKIDPKILAEAFNNIPFTGLTEANQKLVEAKTNLKELLTTKSTNETQQNIQNIKNAVAELTKLGSKSSALSDKNGIVNSLQLGKLDEAIEKWTELTKRHKEYTKDDTKNNLNADARNNIWGNNAKIIDDSFAELVKSGDIAQATQQVHQYQQELDNIHATQLQSINENLKNVTNSFGTASNAVQQLTSSTVDSAKAQYELNQSVEQLGSRIGYFFSAISAVNLLRKALNNAYETVKELDDVMTETAVVTDFSISDMWDQLPTYAKNASELGVSIKDVYNSATLYYQQGLKTNEVMALSNSTLKMARIASLDATEATDRMTNALRGFNMELNETNAERVSDVYSQLAAITASDVDEISTAMTKVASLANSANMSFENTAAFLSQIIETTRESADTAGTALKTVIARFAEMKVNPTEIVDVEGEEVSYNKVDEALKSAGISLNDFMNGTEGLDSVFMRLSAKWDTMDIATQRYIATMAAGSRQQSRFIALMQDYGRMQELTTEAVNANGAASKQYAKTLDSVQSKLAKLDNEWNQFTMDLMNSEWLKSLIDLGTNLLSLINDITANFGDLGGAIVKIGGLIAGFKIGSNLTGNIKETLLPEFAKLGKMGAAETSKYFVNGLRGTATPTRTVKLKDLTDEQLNSEDFLKTGVTTQSVMTSKQSVQNFYKSKISDLDQALNGVDLNQSQGLINTLGNADYNSLSDNKRYALNQARYEIELDNERQQLQVGLDSYTQSMEQATTVAQQMAATQRAQADAAKYNTNVIGLESGEIENQSAKVSQCAIAWAGLAATGAAILSFASTFMEDGSRGQEILEGLSGALATFAGILVALPPIFKTLKLSIADSFPIIAGISAFLTIVITGIKQLLEYNYKNSLTGKLESAQETLDSLTDTISEVSGDIEGLESELATLDEYQSGFDGLIEGSAAFNEQLLKNNQAVLDLISTYPELTEALESEGGILSLNQTKVEEYLETQKEGLLKLNRAKTGVQIQENQLSNDKDEEDIYGEYYKRITARGNSDGIVYDTVSFFTDLTSKLSGQSAAQTLMSSGNGTYTVEDLADEIRQALNGESELNYNALKEISEKYGVDEDTINQIAASVHQIDTNTANENKEQAAILKAALTTNLDKDITSSDIGQDIITATSNISGENYDNLLNEKIAEYDEKDWLPQDYVEQYKKVFNVDELPDTLKNLGTTKQAEEIKKLLASNDVSADLEQGVENIFNAFSEAGINSKSKNIIGILSGNLDLLDTSLITVGNDAGDIGEELADDFLYGLSDLGMSAEQLAKNLGMTGDDLVKQLTDRYLNDYKTAQEESIKMSKNLVASMAKATKSSNFDSLAQKINYKQQKAVISVLNTLETTGVDAAEAFLTGISKVVDNPDVFNELTDLYSSVNGSDAINSYAKLVSASEDVSKSSNYRSQAEDLLNNEAFSSGNQLRQYLQSSDYTDKKKNIAKKIESKNGLTVDNINDLATESELLSQMLDNGAISAANLGIALTKLQKNEISIDGLTDRVIAAIDSFNSLNTAVQNTAENIKNADFGASSSELIASMHEQAEDFEELIKGNNFGDVQVEEYLKYFYNEDKVKQIADGTEESIERIKKASEDLIKYTRGNGINFVDAYAADPLNQLEQLKMTQVAYGQYIAELKGGTTTKELIQAFMDKEGWTEDYATSQVSKITALNPALKSALGQSDYIDSMKKLALESDVVNGKIALTNAELQTLTEYSRKTTEQIKADLAEITGINVDNIITFDVQTVFSDGMGGTTESYDQIVENFSKQLNVSSDDLLVELDVLTETGNIDYDKLVAILEAYGFLEEDITNTANAFAGFFEKNLISQAITVEKKDQNGLYESIATPVKAASVENLKEGIEQAEKEADYSILGQNLTTTITSAFTAAVTELAEKYPGLNEILQGSEETQAKAKAKALDTKDKEEVDDEQYRRNLRAQQAKQQYLASQKTTVTNTTKDATVTLNEEALNNLSTNNTIATLQYDSTSITEGMEDMDDKLKEIENDLDRLYNLTALIESNQKWGSLASKAFDNLVNYSKSITGDYADMNKKLELITAQYKSYQSEAEGLVAKREGRQAQAEALAKQYSEYVSYDSGTNTMQIDWDKINEFAKTYNTEDTLEEYNYNKDKEAYDDIKDAISKMEGYVDDINDSNSELYDIQAKVEELKQIGATDTQTMITRVRDALKEIDQKELDKLKELNSTIQESNEKIVEKMQEQIDESRRARDTAKDKEELDDKRRRLAYLRQDTSGGNRTEILSLQKELDEAEEDYTDTLIDNIISKLQTANEEAAEENTRITDMMQTIIDWNYESGAYAQAAQVAIANSFDEDGTYKGDNAAVKKILEKGENWREDGTIIAGMKKDELGTTMETVGVYLVNNWDKITANDNNFAKGTDISTLEEHLQMSLTGDLGSTSLSDYISGVGSDTIDEMKEESEEVTGLLREITEDLDSKIIEAISSLSGAIESLAGSIGSEIDTSSSSSSNNTSSINNNPSTTEKKSWDAIANSQGNAEENIRGNTTKQVNHATETEVQDYFSQTGWITVGNKKKYVTSQQPGCVYADGWVKIGNYYYEFAKNGINTNYLTEKAWNKLYHFQTGGLADFTGPAWLDGTSSKPEIVLNATDSQTFLNFVDILRHLNDSSDSKTTQNSGTTYYNIDINIDELANDYDVSDMMAQLQEEIEQAAASRNNIAVRRS